MRSRAHTLDSEYGCNRNQQQVAVRADNPYFHPSQYSTGAPPPTHTYTHTTATTLTHGPHRRHQGVYTKRLAEYLHSPTSRCSLCTSLNTCGCLVPVPIPVLPTPLELRGVLGAPVSLSILLLVLTLRYWWSKL